jgi:hypothetical protein
VEIATTADIHAIAPRRILEGGSVAAAQADSRVR